MNNKKKIKIAIIISLILLIVILLLRFVLINKQKENIVYESGKEFQSIKDIVTYFECEYIREEKPDSENFNLDIYLTFGKPLKEGTTVNKDYYYKIAKYIAEFLEYENFRLIDDKEEMLIAVISDKENQVLSRIYVNGDDNYFGNQTSEIQLLEFVEEPITDITINSQEIQNLINSNWYTYRLNFGTKESTFDKYDIYFDEGIEIRTVYMRAYNVIFTEKYNKPVVNNITPNMELQEVIDILGKPTFGSIEEELIGYKGNDIYAFFSNNQISVYNVEKKADTTNLIALLNTFQTDRNVKTFISGITDIWPDYNSYEYDTNYVNLQYALKGVKVQFNITSNHGIIICNNYASEISNDATIQEMRNDSTKIPKYVYFENINSVYEAEQQRSENVYFLYNPESLYVPEEDEEGLEETYYSTSFYVSIEEDRAQVVNLNKEYPNSEIKEKVSDYLWKNDNELIYSVDGKGIYVYNCATRNKQTLIEEKTKFDLNKIDENNILTYNKTKEISL